LSLPLLSLVRSESFNFQYKHTKADNPDIGSIGPLGFSPLGKLADIIESAMNPTCASNVMSLVCHSWFKECKQVDGRSTGNKKWLPSLLCRSECEKHQQVWGTCLEDLDKDPAAKSAFEKQMMSAVLHN
jgi:hypothetical protein